jgi:hypothetical protein
MDIYDGFAFTGFLLLVIGLALWSLALSLVVSGVILMAYGLFGAKAHARATVSKKQSNEPGD